MSEDASEFVQKQVFDALVAHRLNEMRAGAEARRIFNGDGRQDVPAAIRVDNLLALPREVVRWRIEGLLRIGARAIVAAQYKAGKTTFNLNLARCLVDGGEFLGRFRVESVDGTVAIIDTEMVQDQQGQWMADNDIVNSHKLWLWSLRGRVSSFDILDPKVRAQWAQRLRDVNATVLILDCLRPVLDALGLSEDKDAGKFLVALDALLMEAGISECILVHHAGHSGERSRGDSRLRDWPDVEWRIARKGSDVQGQEPGPNAERYFIAEGRDVRVPESLLVFDPVTRRLSLTDGTRAEMRSLSRGEAALPNVLELLREHPPTGNGTSGWSGNAIEITLQRQQIKRDAVRSAIRIGVSTGLIVQSDGPRSSKMHTLNDAHLADLAGPRGSEVQQ